MAVNLHRITEHLPEGVELAIAIAGAPVTGTQGQRHAGFVVKSNDGRLLLYDLAWHNIYRGDEITHDYAYVVAEFLDPFSANAIIGFLAVLLHATQGKIRYSIDYEEGSYFDISSGQALKNGLGQGLTCSTFVLQVLERYGFELVQRETWPLTEEDEKWQHGILEKLIKHTPPDTVDTFLTQFTKVGKVPRFRPEEALGAAAIFEELPLDFPTVAPAAAEVVLELDRLGLS